MDTILSAPTKTATRSEIHCEGGHDRTRTHLPL